eukprot:309371_1
MESSVQSSTMALASATTSNMASAVASTIASSLVPTTSSTMASSISSSTASSVSTSMASLKVCGVSRLGPCALCLRSEITCAGAMRVCDKCELVVHLNCYGRNVKRMDNEEEEQEWYCRPCYAWLLEDSPTNALDAECVICETEVPGFHAFTDVCLPESDGDESEDALWAHIICAEFKGARFDDWENRGGARGVENIRGSSTVCAACRRKPGAKLKCQFPRCSAQFHASCGLANSYFMEIRPMPSEPTDESSAVPANFSFFCQEHRPDRATLSIPGLEVPEEEVDTASCDDLVKTDQTSEMTSSSSPNASISPKKISEPPKKVRKSSNKSKQPRQSPSAKLPAKSSKQPLKTTKKLTKNQQNSTADTISDSARKIPKRVATKLNGVPKKTVKSEISLSNKKLPKAKQTVTTKEIGKSNKKTSSKKRKVPENSISRTAATSAKISFVQKRDSKQNTLVVNNGDPTNLVVKKDDTGTQVSLKLSKLLHFFGSFADEFIKHQITGRKAVRLTDTFLLDAIGVSRAAYRKQIISRIKSWERKEVASFTPQQVVSRLSHELNFFGFYYQTFKRNVSGANFFNLKDTVLQTRFRVSSRQHQSAIMQLVIDHNPEIKSTALLLAKIAASVGGWYKEYRAVFEEYCLSQGLAGISDALLADKMFITVATHRKMLLDVLATFKAELSRTSSTVHPYVKEVPSDEDSGPLVALPKKVGKTGKVVKTEKAGKTGKVGEIDRSAEFEDIFGKIEEDSDETDSMEESEDSDWSPDALTEENDPSNTKSTPSPKKNGISPTKSPRFKFRASGTPKIPSDNNSTDQPTEPASKSAEKSRKIPGKPARLQKIPRIQKIRRRSEAQQTDKDPGSLHSQNSGNRRRSPAKRARLAPRVQTLSRVDDSVPKSPQPGSESISDRLVLPTQPRERPQSVRDRSRRKIKIIDELGVTGSGKANSGGAGTDERKSGREIISSQRSNIREDRGSNGVSGETHQPKRHRSDRRNHSFDKSDFQPDQDSWSRPPPYKGSYAQPNFHGGRGGPRQSPPQYYGAPGDFGPSPRYMGPSGFTGPSPHYMGTSGAPVPSPGYNNYPGASGPAPSPHYSNMGTGGPGPSSRNGPGGPATGLGGSATGPGGPATGPERSPPFSGDLQHFHPPRSPSFEVVKSSDHPMPPPPPPGAPKNARPHKRPAPPPEPNSGPTKEKRRRVEPQPTQPLFIPPTFSYQKAPIATVFLEKPVPKVIRISLKFTQFGGTPLTGLPIPQENRGHLPVRGHCAAKDLWSILSCRATDKYRDRVILARIDPIHEKEFKYYDRLTQALIDEEKSALVVEIPATQLKIYILPPDCDGLDADLFQRYFGVNKPDDVLFAIVLMKGPIGAPSKPQSAQHSQPMQVQQQAMQPGDHSQIMQSVTQSQIMQPVAQSQIMQPVTTQSQMIQSVPRPQIIQPAVQAPTMQQFVQPMQIPEVAAADKQKLMDALRALSKTL